MEFFIICILFIVEVCRLNGTLQAGERNPAAIFYRKNNFFENNALSHPKNRHLHNSTFIYYVTNNACKREREQV